LFKAV